MFVILNTTGNYAIIEGDIHDELCTLKSNQFERRSGLFNKGGTWLQVKMINNDESRRRNLLHEAEEGKNSDECEGLDENKTFFK